MSTEAINENPPKPPWRIRLSSWKWWVYGDVNSLPKEKAPKGFKVQLVLALAVWLLIGLHPWVSTWLNSEVPEQAALQILEGQVIKTARKAPHIYLRMKDGSVKELELPVFLNNLGGTVYAARPRPSWGESNQKLLGCEAIVWVSVPKYTFWDRYRVWEIRCQNSNLATLELLKPDFELFGRGLLVFVCLPFIAFIIFIRMRRGYYE